MLLEFPFGGNSNSNPNSNLVPPCYFRYQKLIWTRLFSVGKEGGGEELPGHSFEGRKIIGDGEKAQLADKRIFYGRATGRVTTMANNNTLLWTHPTNVTPTPRRLPPRDTVHRLVYCYNFSL